MSLLQAQFGEHEPTSFNGNLAELIKAIREYYAKPFDEMKKMIPHFRRLEDKLNSFHTSLGEPARDYIEEILDELKKEDDIFEKLEASFSFACSSITKRLTPSRPFNLEDFSYQYHNYEALPWLQFFGSTNIEDDKYLSVVKEIFRSVCCQENIIFIDSSTK